ncbi:MAG: putative metal-binding membrane protein [Alphaproteobacteria bacterium]|jgi:predicted metal-binding membrane protein
MTMDPIELVVKRDRLVVMFGLAGATALAWAYLVHLASGMDAMAAMGEALVHTRTTAWTGVDFILMFLMWSVMMVGMMLPGASPMILLFASINRKRREKSGPYVSTGLFASGYATAWSAFSLGATLLQWALHSVGLLSPMMASTTAVFGGAALVAAGVYQWTPLKSACLRHCQTPLSFVMSHWRDGKLGAYRMGLQHGAFCVGCCWVLMALLFVGGVMNLFWVAGLAVFVFVEKLAPPGPWPPRLVGAVLIAWGGWILLSAL